MNTGEHWRQVKRLFLAAQALAPAERDGWLVAECGADQALLDEVRNLLGARRDDQDILADNAMGLLRRLHDPVAPADRAGERVGPYRLLRLIGEGGMGSVYLAAREDGDFSQQVALKLVRADFVGAQSRARFLREREFLARLVHPHIAQLHDGGVADDGTPYFTLEYVEGLPLTRYADQHGLDLRQRVRLLLQVCAAVAYAHRNLIVHRDLKPSNILVTSDGVIKLLDFGIAKLLDGDEGSGTATQSRLMTPEYAAPEQVLGEPITTATDVYAIGVLGYELLCGRLPYARADAGAVSWAKAVVEDTPDSLARALQRTGRAAAAPGAEALAATRATNLPTLRRRLRGDLDRIVQRALVKQPEARYASVTALAEDLEANLDGRAISGSSPRYRLGRFVRRHWLPLGAAAAIVLVLLASAAAVIWQARQTERQARTTLAVKDFLFGLFAAVDPHEAKGREVSAHELLDRGAQRIEHNRGLDAIQQAEIEAALGRIYYQLGLFEQASKLQDNAIQTLAREHLQPLLIAQTEAERADTLAELGDLKQANDLSTAASTELEHVAAGAIDRLRVLEAHANIAKGQRDFDAMQRYADAGLALARQPGIDTSSLFRALMASGTAHWGSSHFEQAEAYYREALALVLPDAGPGDLDVARARMNLATALQSRSHYAEAEQTVLLALDTLDKVLGSDHPITMTARRDLGLAYYHQGKYGPAREALQQVQAAQRHKLGDAHPALAGTDINLGLVLIDSVQLVEAEQVLDEAMAIFEKKYGRDYQGARVALGDLAVVHMQQGKLDLARTELQEVKDREQALGLPNADGFVTDYRIGEVLRLQGQLAEAVALQRSTLTTIQQANGDASRHAALAHQYLALALRDSGDEAAATAEFRAALLSYQGYIPNAEHPLAATTRYELGLLLVRHDATRAEGVRLFGEALQLREKFLGTDEPRTQQVRAAIAAAQPAPRP